MGQDISGNMNTDSDNTDSDDYISDSTLARRLASGEYVKADMYYYAGCGTVAIKVWA
jgi:hypothetical protein